MENAPAVKTNEANLEELNKKIVEIKRKIVLKGEPLIILTSILCADRGRQHRNEGKVQNLMTSLPAFLCLFRLFYRNVHFLLEGQKKANIEEWVSKHLDDF